ncbi:MAG TPA: addiction module toxin, HicA family [Armatimonadetes bacterium]|nr:addiction module toxin, HicA family [Armatimonadota bacterium]
MLRLPSATFRSPSCQHDPRAPRHRAGAHRRTDFTLAKVRGSPHYFVKERAKVTVPVHSGKTLSLSLLLSILRQAGLTMDELLDG